MKLNAQDNEKILQFIAQKGVTKVATKKARGYVGKASLRKAKVVKLRMPKAEKVTADFSDIDSKKIRIVSEQNPRKEGTHGYNNFEKYRDGMTVAEFRTVGLGMNHLRWDVEHGFIQLV